MTNHSKEVGAFSRVSGLHGVWICDWTSHAFADLGIVAKKHQMYWTVLFMLQLIKTHPSQSSLSGQTILWPTQVHWASINRISSAAFRLQLCRVHCLGEHTLLAPGATLHGDWTLRTTKIQLEMVIPHSVFLLLPHRFCVPKLYKRGLVRPIPETWHCLWLQCQRHNQRGQSESKCSWRQICCSGVLGRNVLRRDWLMLWFNSGRAIAIGGFQHECFLQMIGSDCSGWSFSSWFYK